MNGNYGRQNKRKWLKSLKPGDEVLTTYNWGGGPFSPRVVKLTQIQFIDSPDSLVASKVAVCFEGLNNGLGYVDSYWIQPLPNTKIDA